MFHARRTQEAERDLREIAFRIAYVDKRPLTADRIIDELIEQVETLARLAGDAVMGSALPEIGDGVRAFSYKRWVILFRYQPHGVDVLRFADSSQDYLSWRLQP
jgi:plasmid stabilization system protein ParE